MAKILVAVTHSITLKIWNLFGVWNWDLGTSAKSGGLRFGILGLPSQAAWALGFEPWDFRKERSCDFQNQEARMIPTNDVRPVTIRPLQLSSIV
jgi:hypothetical protein